MTAEELRFLFRMLIDSGRTMTSLAEDIGVETSTLSRFLSGSAPRQAQLEAYQSYVRRERILLAPEALPGALPKRRDVTPPRPTPRQRHARQWPEASPTPSESDTRRDLLPGYWVGRLDAILDAYEEANARLRAFIAHGAEWEANSVRHTAIRAAQAAQAMGHTPRPSSLTGTPDPSEAERFFLAVQQVLAGGRPDGESRQVDHSEPGSATPSASPRSEPNRRDATG